MNVPEGEGRWRRLWRVPRSRLWLGVPAGGALAFVVGILFWGGFNWAVELSSTEAFCISCHEMGDNVYPEYKQTIHYSNSAGVRATCPDCHVPHPWGYKMLRKIGATFNELPKHFIGYIDTKEKFEAKRLELAQDVWKTMKSTDSRECRNCHALEHMDLAAQDKMARRKHSPEYQKEHNVTCIDCHKGIAHHLPEGAVTGASG